MTVEGRITAGGLDVSATDRCACRSAVPRPPGSRLPLAKADLRTGDRHRAGVPDGAGRAHRRHRRAHRVQRTGRRRRIGGPSRRRPFPADDPRRRPQARPRRPAGADRRDCRDARRPAMAALGPRSPSAPDCSRDATGRIAVTAANTALTPKLAARDLHGTVQVEPVESRPGRCRGRPRRWNGRRVGWHSSAAPTASSPTAACNCATST